MTRRFRLTVTAVATAAAILASAAAQRSQAGVEASAADVELRVMAAGRGKVEVTPGPGGDPKAVCTSSTNNPECFEKSGFGGALVYPQGTKVTVEAIPDAGVSLVRWSTPACEGKNPCALTLDESLDLSATFSKANVGVTIRGSGRVTAAGASLNPNPCERVGDSELRCTDDVAPGTTVTFTAAAAPGKTPQSWGGICKGTPAASPCTVTTTGYDYEWATARFSDATGDPSTPGQPQFRLAVSKRGNGVVRSSPAAAGGAVDCGGTCRVAFVYGERTTLTAEPGGNSSFTGWLGAPPACGPSPRCELPVGPFLSVQATFDQKRPDLRLTAASDHPAPLRPGDAFTVLLTATAGADGGGADGIDLVITLPPALTVTGSQADRGSGCTGARVVTCFLDFLGTGQAANVRLGLRLERAAPSTLRATLTSRQTDQNAADNALALPLAVEGVRPPAKELNGTAGDDRLTGTSAAETINGLRGADRIDGRGGRDTLRGGAGDDRVEGGPGADLVVGGTGRDVLSGGPGDDRILSRDGARDRVTCGAGRDRVEADRRDAVSRDCEIVLRGG